MGYHIIFAIITLPSVVCITRFNQPRENIWVTLANQTNQTSLCLSLGGVTNPFRTCLVGLPIWEPGEFCGWVNNGTLCNTTMNTTRASSGTSEQMFPDGHRQCQLILSLNATLHSPPEELDLFGSASASLGNNTEGDWVSFTPINPQN